MKIRLHENLQAKYFTGENILIYGNLLILFIASSPGSQIFWNIKKIREPEDEANLYIHVDFLIPNPGILLSIKTWK